MERRAPSSSRKITSLGVIDAARAAAFLPLPADLDTADIDRLIVTLEPADGTTEPSADEVATGTV